MKEPLPDPGPFQDGAVIRSLPQLLDAINRRRASRGWTFRQLNTVIGSNLDLNAMIRRGNGTGASIFKFLDALGLELVVQVKPTATGSRRERAKRLRQEASQSAAEPGGVPEE